MPLGVRKTSSSTFGSDREGCAVGRGGEAVVGAAGSDWHEIVKTASNKAAKTIGRAEEKKNGETENRVDPFWCKVSGLLEFMNFFLLVEFCLTVCVQVEGNSMCLAKFLHAAKLLQDRLTGHKSFLLGF